jgi:hypothetical protein
MNYDTAVPLPPPPLPASKQGDSSGTPNVDPLSIANVDWSVEILVSSSEVSRVAVPVVNLTLTLTDGTVQSYRLSQQDMHQWRFTLAKAVKDAAYLDSKAPPVVGGGTKRKAL